MKTAEGWYRLAKGWQQQLNEIETHELTVFEAQLLEDLNRHLVDMEGDDPFTKHGVELSAISEDGGLHFNVRRDHDHEGAG